MKKRIVIVVAGGILLAGLCGLASRLGSFSFTLPIPHRPRFDADTATYPSPLRVSGNKILDAVGREVVLRGVMPADPARLARKGKFERAFFDQIASTGANAVRIPVHPENWERDPDYLWRYLDPIVTWNGENGVYTIIDLHFIGNIETSGGDQMPDIDTHSRVFATDFWRQVAAYFQDAPHVILEIFNEPAGIGPDAWRAGAAGLVATIREAGADQLIIVGGVEYSRDLSWVLAGPVPGENIAYAAHIYPAHSQVSWDRWFGTVSEQYPVVMTEWGWMETDRTGVQPYLVGRQDSYGGPLMEYLEERGIGWVACWYDDEWLPAMFDSGFMKSNAYGDFALGMLRGEPR